MKTVSLEVPPRPTAIPHQFRVDIPPSFGQGGIDIISFPSGIQLLQADWQFQQATLCQSSLKEYSVGFSFCLHGRFDYHPACFDRPFAVKAGESGFFSFPKEIDCQETADGGRMFRVVVLLKSEQLFQLMNGDEDRFCPLLKSLEKSSSTRIAQSTTPLIKSVLHQLLHCPYCGTTRQIYLEGKTMELIAHMLEQLCPRGGCCHGCPVKSSDADRAHHAAHMLIRDLNNPPDIIKIAKSVGLSRTKLFRCFRQTFGLSPFEYLRNRRLQMAMHLLQDGEVNVTEAALLVGYTNLSYFAKAFKLMFGIAPSELRKSIQA
ncbi:helix-turn-helix transcriptional regulator [Desulfobulbus rhabdoformis]|uniref:AraC family transcriptional regulator n=1 Tax=Desulfobulbus rhabdoformis TaxID=34032 RepID=UPI0019639B9B|nr:AraC family transcriptional regulator [Desulfobulbus rhabdoformis]MBM9616732.1 helix-turn-helix transcriptional regulator [Desulfobulbus rhabdoformis]